MATDEIDFVTLFLKLHNYMVLPWSPSKSFLLMAPKRPEDLIHFFESKTWILKTSDLEICLNFISTYTSTNIHLYFKSYGKTAFQRTGFDRCCKNLKYWWDNTQATHCNAFNHERGEDLLMLTYMQFTQYTKPWM